MYEATLDNMRMTVEEADANKEVSARQEVQAGEMVGSQRWWGQYSTLAGT